MIKLLAICGSPVKKSSTEILLRRTTDSIREALKPSHKVRLTWVHLNDLNMIPCQACGEAPTPRWCFFEDDLTDVYKALAECDCLLIGSPVHFDTVSSQTKLFLDRCNCFRPADFNDIEPNHNFIKLIRNKRPGAMVLVGGKHGWFEGARRTIAGFLKWVEVTNEGKVVYRSEDFKRSGTVLEGPEILAEADELGRKLAQLLKD